MITAEMRRKMDRFEFDPPQVRSNASRRLLQTDVSRIYELADEGHDTATIAERVGIKPSSVNYRLANRNQPRARGTKGK